MTEPGEEEAGGPLETLVGLARGGDRTALEEVIVRIQPRLYNLAVRMVGHPVDAEDATQEILIKIVTHLGAFRGESRFSTWAWRIAVNHLLTMRKRRAEQAALSFTAFAADLAGGLTDSAFPSPESVADRLLAEEVKVGCTQAMLLCLSREERAAYVLGEVFEVLDTDGAAICAISPAAYRKRLSRARQAIRAFMQRNCGIVNPTNPCRCHRRVATAIAKGRVDPQTLLFARAGEDPAVLRGIAEMEELDRAAALFRTHPTYQAPEALRTSLRRMLDSGRLSVLA